MVTFVSLLFLIQFQGKYSLTVLSRLLAILNWAGECIWCLSKQRYTFLKSNQITWIRTSAFQHFWWPDFLALKLVDFFLASFAWWGGGHLDCCKLHGICRRSGKSLHCTNGSQMTNYVNCKIYHLSPMSLPRTEWIQDFIALI